MRAIIRIQFNQADTKKSRQALEDFLRLEGFNVVDLEADKEWLGSPRQSLVRDKISSFIDSMAKPEEKGLNIVDYIFSNSGTEGIVASRKENELIVIIYKHNLEKLKSVCMVLSESIVGHFNRFTKRSYFSVTSFVENITISDIDIREDGRQTNILTGRVITSRRGKRRRIHKEKRFEYVLGRVLLALIILAMSFSFYANFKYGFRVDRLNNQIEYWVDFAERLTGPLIVTASVLWFNLWSEKLKTMNNKVVIEWK